MKGKSLSFKKFLLSGVLLTGLIVPSSFLKAQDAPQSLAGLIPDNALFVIRLYKAAQTIENLKDTALWDATVEGPIKQRLKEEGKLEEIRRSEREFENVTGIKPGKFLKRLMGREVLVALFRGKSKEPDFLVLTLGMEGVEAEKELDKLLLPLRDNGELFFLEEKTYKETRIRHIKNREGKEFYLLNHRSATAISNNLKLIEHAIDLARQEAYDSLPEYGPAQETCGNLVEDAFLAWYVNVPEILELAKGLPIPHKAKPVLRVLKLVNGVAQATWLEYDRIQSRTRVSVKVHKLPQYLRSCWAEPAETSYFAPYLPSEGQILGGMAFRVKFVDLAKALLEASPPRLRERLKAQMQAFGDAFLGGKSLLKDLLPSIGPEMLFLASDIDQSDPAPAEVSFLLQIKKRKGFELLKTALKVAKGLVQIAKPEEAQRMTVQEGTNKLVITADIQGFSPTLYLTPKALILSSSRTCCEQIAQWLSNPPEASLAEVVPPFKGFFCGLDLQAVARWVGKNRNFFAAERARKEGLSLEQASKDIDTFKAFLGKFAAATSHGITTENAFEVISEILVAY